MEVVAAVETGRCWISKISTWAFSGVGERRVSLLLRDLRRVRVGSSAFPASLLEGLFADGVRTSWIFGCWVTMAAQPLVRKIKRQGRRWENRKRAAQERVTRTKRVLLRRSSAKLKGGRTCEMVKSCRREKSSMLFCRSRILRKKSLLRSGAGLIFGAGANGGPSSHSMLRTISSFDGIGAGGWRARKEGIMMKKIRIASGKTARSDGSRQMKE